MKKFSLIVIILILLSCNSNSTIPDFSSDINYAYRSIQYSGNPEKKDIISHKYFNKNGKLVEQIGKEYRIKYLYNTKGILIEKINCRIYNCDINWRQIFVYDNNGNYIGIKNIEGQKVQKFHQIKFYDKNNNLIKELFNAGTDIEGIAWENWKYYSYKNDRIEAEIQKINDEIVWNGKYKYDINDNLISIIRKNKSKYEIELFHYDEHKKLIKKSITNDELLKDNVLFSVHNNSTTYKYDNLERLTEEITFNHKKEEYRRFIYKYDVKE